MILCVDPGLRGCGCASFSGDGNLIKASYVKSPNKSDRGAVAWAEMAYAINEAYPLANILVIETQRIRPQDTRAIHGAIMEVQGVAGAIIGLFCDMGVRGYTPEQWKGSIKGDVMTERIKARMTWEDWRVFESPGKTLEHNVVDAVGIGLHYFGRLERARVYAR